MILFVSVGNTRIKLALQDNLQILSCSCHLDKMKSEFEPLLTSFIGKYEAITRIVYCSVVDQANQFLLDSLTSLDTPIVIIDSHLIYQVDYETYPQLGSDRKMACEAVACIDSSAIVIDLGTATTLNVFVDKVFVGGLIMPGIEMAYHSLNLRTSKIDVAKLVHTDRLLGQDTLTNVSSGIINMTSMALNSMIAKIKLEYEYDFNVYLTGGNACYILERLDFLFTYDEDLLIKGMLQFA